MVFAVNPVQSSPNNFSAFQALAKQLNGTGSTGTGAPNGAEAGKISTRMVMVSAAAGVLGGLVALFL